MVGPLLIAYFLPYYTRDSEKKGRQARARTHTRTRARTHTHVPTAWVCQRRSLANPRDRTPVRRYPASACVHACCRTISGGVIGGSRQCLGGGGLGACQRQAGCRTLTAFPAHGKSRTDPPPPPPHMHFGFYGSLSHF